FIDNYNLTGNQEWLDAGVKYYDFLLNKRDTDPDGYKGWIGPYIYDKSYWQDALVGDAIIFAGILDFSVLVLEDKKLKKKYGDKARAYLETAKKDVIEKWDKRGCFYEDGPFGGYIGFGKFFKPGDISEWISKPEVNRAGVSHPFNKQMDVAEVCLRIHRITGDKKYWNLAEKIYYTAKRRFQYFDDHYCWNYWEPLYPGDVDFDKQNTKHWVGVHNWRSGYQAGEVSKIVEAYHHGIVFNKEDIQRIINTNLEVMWNKDGENPVFINSNGLGAEHDTTGLASFKRAFGHSNDFENQGQLWTSLLDFDQTVRDLYELRFEENDDSESYQIYKKEILAHPPGFNRKHAKDNVKVPEMEFTACEDLYHAAVLPHSIPQNGQSIISCKSWKGGELLIDLYTVSGEKVTNLFRGNIRPGFFMMKWDGKNPDGKQYKGDYRIRWTINNGHREFPVKI
ncbi:MAG: hypothetical protein LC658_00005, partial [Bacteroidales bacterium]|nr:hypothetical protein [Bacteroidales bacterium]